MTWNYGDVPTWVEAGATVGAFIAAGFAAKWTANTAKSARKQVDAAEKQVAIARDQAQLAEKATQGQLAAMGQQLELATGEAKAAEGRFLRAQLDALAPTVYACARWPRITARPRSDHLATPDDLFNPKYDLKAPLEIRSDEHHFFGITFEVELVNCSNIPARIDFIRNDNGEFKNLPQGEEVTLPPNGRRQVTWLRRLTSSELRTEGQVGDAGQSFAQIQYWLRDLGMNVQDTYGFMLDLRYFAVDGSRLIVQPQPAFPWVERFASQIPPRHYERLEAVQDDSADTSEQ